MDPADPTNPVNPADAAESEPQGGDRWTHRLRRAPMLTILLAVFSVWATMMLIILILNLPGLAHFLGLAHAEEGEWVFKVYRIHGFAWTWVRSDDPHSLYMPIGLLEGSASEELVLDSEIYWQIAGNWVFQHSELPRHSPNVTIFPGGLPARSGESGHVVKAVDLDFVEETNTTLEILFLPFLAVVVTLGYLSKKHGFSLFPWRSAPETLLRAFIGYVAWGTVISFGILALLKLAPGSETIPFVVSGAHNLVDGLWFMFIFPMPPTACIAQTLQLILVFAEVLFGILSRPALWIVKRLGLDMEMIALGTGLVLNVGFIALLPAKLGSAVAAPICLLLAVIILMRPAPRYRRAAFIWLGVVGIGFVLFHGLILVLRQIPLYRWLGDLLGGLIMFTMVAIISFLAGGLLGDYLGDYLGKRVNYQLPPA